MVSASGSALDFGFRVVRAEKSRQLSKGLHMGPGRSWSALSGAGDPGHFCPALAVLGGAAPVMGKCGTILAVRCPSPGRSAVAFGRYGPCWAMCVAPWAAWMPVSDVEAKGERPGGHFDCSLVVSAGRRRLRSVGSLGRPPAVRRLCWKNSGVLGQFSPAHCRISGPRRRLYPKMGGLGRPGGGRGQTWIVLAVC